MKRLAAVLGLAAMASGCLSYQGLRNYEAQTVPEQAWRIRAGADEGGMTYAVFYDLLADATGWWEWLKAEPGPCIGRFGGDAIIAALGIYAGKRTWLDDSPDAASAAELDALRAEVERVRAELLRRTDPAE